MIYPENLFVKGAGRNGSPILLQNMLKIMAANGTEYRLSSTLEVWFWVKKTLPRAGKTEDGKRKYLLQSEQYR